MYNFCPNCGFKNDSEDKDFLKCKNCNKRFYNNSKPTSSVLPLFGDEVLLSIRGVEPSIGKLDIIGGFLQAFEDPLEGALREFEEETKLKLKEEDMEYLGIWMGDDYKFEGTEYATLNIHYLVKFNSKLELTPSDDVADLVWININEINEDDLAFNYAKKVLKEVKKRIS